MHGHHGSSRTLGRGPGKYDAEPIRGLLMQVWQILYRIKRWALLPV
uniref:Uncharacterized protein n=1 Tax=Sinorhizobium meliloti (strain SM11) TaxID=707241 RepID=A4KVI6_SINMM|nr:hypothetical protein [Sinorhizobium meliloti SM11]